MNYWNKMLQNLSNIIFPDNVADDTLSSQIDTALQEGRTLWTDYGNYIDPYVVKDFQDKWCFAYHMAKKRTEKLSFTLGLSGRKIRNTAPEFIKMYEQLPAALRAHNDRVSKEKIAFAAKLILPVEGRNLDSQQMQCITKEAKNHLVLAGAGSGKTTTIVGYVKYLLKKGICCASDVLVLSFTNASAAEMSQRLNKELGTPVPAITFHKLGLEIITSVQGKKPKIYESKFRQFVRQQLDVLVQDSAYLRKLCVYLTYHGTNQKAEFDFKTEEEYKAYLSFNPPVTLKKETVKSYGELDIANFLTQNGIAYIYEKAYPVDTRTSEYGQYHPDFYLPDFDLYIEYFGINRQDEVPPYFTGKNGMTPAETYMAGISWKRELHRDHGTRMIEVYAYEKLEEQLLPCLEKRLKEAGVTFFPLSPKELWNEISGNENQQLDRIADLFETVITLTKSNNCVLRDIRERNHGFRNLSSIDAVLELIQPIFDSYQEQLCMNGEIDFNDMINLAAEYVQSGKFVHHYRYVVIDEYQDISQSRYRLLDSMRRQKDYKLFCVGDDWQSIYRFSGSDIGFILNFEKYWGASEISRIETTYRFPPSLISVSGSFIMKNPEQKKKTLRSPVTDCGFSVGKITGYTDDYAIEFLTEKLDDLPQNSSVLFLGRYRFDIHMLDRHQQFFYGYNTAAKQTKVTYAKRSDLKITYMTVHGSKGLQADYVFLLNNKAYGMGFPSQISDAPILQILLDNCDHYPFAEERRLFYVAITRAKKKVWLVTVKDNESIFVKEIVDMYGKEIQREQYTCPRCGARLVKRNGKYGEFLGCANFSKTGCDYTRNIRKGKRG